MCMTGLYVLLDWAKDDYVFVDTGVGCVSGLCGCVSFKLLLLHVWCWCMHWFDTADAAFCNSSAIPVHLHEYSEFNSILVFIQLLYHTIFHLLTSFYSSSPPTGPASSTKTKS